MPAEIGAELTGNPAVRKISFTGSTRVGSLLMRSARRQREAAVASSSAATRPSSSSTMPISMLAVEGAIASKFRNGGQTCVCANRILVQAGVYDAFAEQASRRGSRP